MVNLAYVLVIGYLALCVLFAAEGIYYAVRWLRDRWRWLKWFSWN